MFSGGKGHLVLFLWKNSKEICPDFDPDDFLSSSAKLATPLLKKLSNPEEEVLSCTNILIVLIKSKVLVIITYLINVWSMVSQSTSSKPTVPTL